MNFSSLLTILIVLLIIQETIISTMADKKFIEMICKSTPNCNLCLDILLADPKSQNADLTELALIVVDAVKVKGVETIKQIEDLKVSHPNLRAALDKCAKLYHGVVEVDVREAKYALNHGGLKFAEDAIADVPVESQACEREFGQASPLTGMNKAIEDVANVGRAIIRMLF